MMTTREMRLDAPPETLDDDPFVTTLMTRWLVGVTTDVSLATALRLMAESGFRHLPVFDRPHFCGLLLETDIVNHLLAGDPEERSTRSIAPLIRPAPTVTTSARRSAAARSMQDVGLDAVLVIDRNRLAGIVTATDLIRSLAGSAGNGRSGT